MTRLLVLLDDVISVCSANFLPITHNTHKSYNLFVLHNYYNDLVVHAFSYYTPTVYYPKLECSYMYFLIHLEERL